MSSNSSTDVTDTSSTDTFLTIVDNKLARRRYFREKQRNYRRKLNADVAIVKAQFEHLQSIRDGLQASMPLSVAPREDSDGPLSWYSIATVFKREALQVLTDRHPLITQTQEYQSLTKAIQRFVVMNIPPPMSRSNAWHSATLVADPRARNLAKEWLTQQMYHNMHEPLALLPALRSDEEFFQFDLEASDEDESFVGLHRIQCIFPGTLASFRRFVQSNMREVMFKEPQKAIEECTANTRLFCTTTANGVFINSLQGHFVEADRFIVVVRQVEHDEAHACHPMLTQRHYRSWTEVRQVSPTHILMRLVGFLSRSFRAHKGFVSSDELAALGGIDVTGIEDDDQKDEYVRRELIRLENADFVPWRQRFTSAMQASLQQHDDTSH
ncbi:hypothetical protein H257_07639 [Aphanomyces astaci]|uniref:BZIP domain-containing protein n=1 Tax=Aphanomyces astaci TaxID=112090 RepID=W4GIE0_APHAT|nr:hypothetical protein H257_07639 [Aphanomyces astaci]ETV78809.1 hypothetical protein H257_07639 [Aphanomyces astaci]|eukprot:XP_009831528.1 hypothetical protein H257_07639 [Aphanomyces astaci]